MSRPDSAPSVHEHTSELPTHETREEPIPEAGLLGRAIDRLGFIFAVGIVAAAVFLLMEVFLRYALNAPTIWAHETATFLCGLAFLYGGLFCVSRDRHIRVVLIYDALPARARKALDIFTSLASMIASGFFAYAAWLMLSKAVWSPMGDLRLERSGSAWNPPLPAYLKIFLFVLMLVMCAQFAVIVVKQLKKPAKDI
ncbi:TRAP transporter small permease subunit [Alloyangia pacifica]|uniref:TRAP transporter small permease subunit n=1 Tax=Alloyangia pacifica TaxID=311180 RepID=UPI001CFC755C|nr:TRAP transporter small permease [Alloyangia pacifica]